MALLSLAPQSFSSFKSRVPLFAAPRVNEFVKRLPSFLRSTFAEPWGAVYSTADACLELRQDGYLIVAVGDATVFELLRCGIRPDLAIIDYREKRQALTADKLAALQPFSASGAKKIRNPPGTITRELEDAVRAFFEHPRPTLFLIEGEDDLAVLPSLLFAPNGTRICYGQPERGIVVLVESEELRQRAQHVYALFENVPDTP